MNTVFMALGLFFLSLELSASPKASLKNPKRALLGFWEIESTMYFRPGFRDLIVRPKYGSEPYILSQDQAIHKKGTKVGTWKILKSKIFWMTKKQTLFGHLKRDYGSLKIILIQSHPNVLIKQTLKRKTGHSKPFKESLDSKILKKTTRQTNIIELLDRI